MTELDAVLTHCGFKFSGIPGAVEWMVSLVDLDGTRTLSLNEFRFFIGNLLKFKRAFKKADSDKSAALSTAELHALLTKQQMRFDAKQAALLLSLVDKNSSGELQLEEWMLLSVFLRFVKIQFLLADADCSGHLTRSEVSRYLPALGLKIDDDHLSKLMAKLDSDGNTQTLTFEEFALLCAMVKLGD